MHTYLHTHYIHTYIHTCIRKRRGLYASGGVGLTESLVYIHTHITCTHTYTNTAFTRTYTHAYLSGGVGLTESLDRDRLTCVYALM